VTLSVSIADDDLTGAEAYLARRAEEHDGARAEDRIVGMVLGAAKAAGWGKKRRRNKA
jgi:hypothetical protein